MEHRVIIYGVADGQWRWRRVAANGRIVADGGESYHNRGDCQDMAVKVNAQPYILELQAVDSVESDLSQGQVVGLAGEDLARPGVRIFPTDSEARAVDG